MFPRPRVPGGDAVPDTGQAAECQLQADEVGRGPLAGPVTAAAVILDPQSIPQGLNDSKKLTARRRAEIADDIWLMAQVAVAHASVAEIDELNILWASMLAMKL